MKKFLLFLLTVFIGYSCSKDSKIEVKDPKLKVSDDSVLLVAQQYGILDLSTEPRGTLSFSVKSCPSWLHVSPDTGVVTFNTIHLYLSTGNIPNPGDVSGNLTIHSSAGDITVFVRAISDPGLPESITFHPLDTLKSFFIFNENNSTSPFNVSVSNNYITASPQTGTFTSAGAKEIKLRPDRTQLGNDVYYSTVFVDVNGQFDSIHVTVENLQDHKIMLPNDVADAEYSRLTQSIIYISTDSKLNIFHTDTKSVESIALTYPPICVSVSADGHYAVTGHDGHVSWIDLLTKTVKSTIDLPCEPSDIVLANNGWAYVTPSSGSWDNVQCVKLADGTVYPSTGYDVSTPARIKLHPSGNYIYLADQGVSPADLHKLDIRNGIAHYLYDSPYHGDYPSGGDLWLTEDGVRIFTQPKSVFKTSEIESQDMLYNGKIVYENDPNKYNSIQWLDHSASAGKLFIIFNGEYYWEDVNPPYVYIYDATNLVMSSKIRLSSFFVPDGSGGGTYYDPEPYFVFSNTAGTKVYVLTKALESGLLHEWAFEEIVVQ